MKKIRLFGYSIYIRFGISVLKTITVSIPDKADDVHIDDGKIGYYRCSTKYYIDLPKAKSHSLISVTKMYDRKTGTYSTNRKASIQLTF